MSVIAGNVIVALCYIGLLGATLFVLKRAAGYQQETKPNIRCFNSSNNPYWTLSKYLGWRYTLLAVALKDKQYLLTQLMSMVLYITAMLRINAVTLWAIALAPVGITLGVFLNEYWRVGNTQRAEEADSNFTKPADDSVSNPEATTRLVLSTLTGIMLTGSIARIAQSVSNIGQLNVLSVLVCVASDQLVIRPIGFLSFLAGVKIWETRQGRSSIQKSPILCHMLVSEYIRSNLEQRIIPDSSSSPPKKQELSPSRVPKVSTSSRFEETNTLFDMLKQRTSDRIDRTERIENPPASAKKEKEQDDAGRVENICLDDRNVFQERNRTDEDDTEKSSKPKKSEVSEEFLCLDLNKENLEATVKRQAKDRRNEDHDDLYLAENFYPAKHEQTLPITITLSPIRQRKPTRSKHKRPNRVLVLTGDSPYLEYLPNMLKKQESENKIRHGKEKPNAPLHARSDFLNGGLKEIPR